MLLCSLLVIRGIKILNKLKTIYIQLRAVKTDNNTSIEVYKILPNQQLHVYKDGYLGDMSKIERCAINVIENIEVPKLGDIIYYESSIICSEGYYEYMGLTEVGNYRMRNISDSKHHVLPEYSKLQRVIATTDMNVDLPDVHHDLVQAYCESPDIIINSMALNFQWEFPKIEVNEVTYKDILSKFFVGKKVIRYTYEECYGRLYNTLEKREHDKLVKREILLIDNLNIGSSYEGDTIYLYSGEIRMSISMNDGLGKIGFVD